jgi:rhodanese-related sulfurtransferase
VLRRLALLAVLAVAAFGLVQVLADDTDARVAAVENGDATLIDVRTQAEWDAGHADRAVHLPLAAVKRGARPDVPKDRTVLVYCRTGRRAAEAVRILEREGWTDVRNVGGLRDWQRAGGALASG